MYHGSAQGIDAKLENAVCPAFIVVMFVCVCVCVCVCVLYTCVDQSGHVATGSG